MSTRRADRKSKNGTRKQSGGKRAPSKWNLQVKKVYEEMKKKDPKTLFKHALVETAKRKKAGKLD